MKLPLPYLLILLLSLGSQLRAQHVFSGHVDTTGQSEIFLSLIDDYRKISGVYPEQIIARAVPDSSGFFSFQGDNLPKEDRIYRIHLSLCPEDEDQASHFNGQCVNSREILFIASRNDTLSLPLNSEDEIFCKISSGRDESSMLMRVDSLKNDMLFDFGSYRSATNQEMNTVNWFDRFSEFGQQLGHPLAQLYIYSIVSDRRSPFYQHYLDHLDDAGFDQLADRLELQLPGSNYGKQLRSELKADQVTTGLKWSLDSWMLWSLIVILLISLGVNFYLIRQKNITPKGKSLVLSNLSQQERTILQLIVDDKTNKEIASELHISLSTVKTHINNLYRKLGVGSRADVKSLWG
ncbi:helix-turn-helix domain-containing protein [Aureitalea marina]|uniref:HTH luxR-type domain-containing protein n=1 Tax=Aureitalea marina TaxID=930804 RepID=A0A2S7KQX8_9FLAO|nr:helix-turn-helix transcriptional regulator [Aureitalea marina]PQB05007.1 hypothetical protein BST85_08965 [Aureitalea marina]